MNELSSLLKRSFEGLGYQQGEYEDAATAAVWLEARGMKGIDMITTSWSRCETGARNQIKLTDSAPAQATLDANDRSVAFCGRVAADLAIAAAADAAVGETHIQRCHDCEAILPSLEHCANQGLHAVAHWVDENSVHIGIANPERSGCDYCCVPRSPDSLAAPEKLTISCSGDGERILALVFELAGGDTAYQKGMKIRWTDMQKAYETTIANGMTVNSYAVRMLTEAADLVLVEATEQSRRGAGD